MMYFYGCINEVGHHWLGADGSRPRYQSFERIGPHALLRIDGGFLPPQAKHGVIYQSVIPGWTIIAMVDNSVDTRPGSNAAFVMPGELSTEQMIAAARHAFPQIAARLAAFRDASAPAEVQPSSPQQEPKP